MNDYVNTKTRTIEDYKKICEQQELALKILNKRLRDKEHDILILNKKMANLRNIIRRKGLVYD